IWEVNLMNSTEEMDDGSSISICFCVSFSEYTVSQQDSDTGARVGFQQEQHGFAQFGKLCGSKRSQNTLTNGIVQKQYLGRLDEDGCQRKQCSLLQEGYACGEQSGEGTDGRSQGHIAHDGEQGADDGHGQVSNQQLKSNRNMRLNP